MSYNLFGSEFKSDPHSVYAQMRQDNPIYCRPAFYGERVMWFITRYDDVAEVLRDHQRFVKSLRTTMTAGELAQLAADSPVLDPVMELMNNHMLNLDVPNHTRLRSLVNKAFTARVVSQMQGRIQRFADQLIDKVQARKQMDLVEQYAYPLPINMIADLIGVPPKDRHKFRLWSSGLVSPSSTANRNPKKYERTKRIIEDFTDYLQRLFDEHRLLMEQGAQPDDDLITQLLQAEEDGDKLSESELFSMMILLIVAGYDTTVNLISNGALLLLQHPAQLDLLMREPERFPNTIEEIMRYESPVDRATMRFVATDLEFHGHAMKRGDAVSLVLGSAGRDERQFDNPDVFDITRENVRHLGFGFGIHYCLGAPLARLEGQIALETLFRRLPNLRLDIEIDKLKWRTNPILRGAQRMPVRWD
ncbi:MAG: cytochrome P450 [Chloroflexota bacterium]